MKRALCVGLVAFSFAASGNAVAQQQIEWKQTVNMPKGLNLPKGVNIDILGIELGDTYADAKAKLQKLLAEVPKPKSAAQETSVDRFINESTGGGGPPLREVKIQFKLPAPGGFVTASYIGQLMLERHLPASVSAGISDGLTLRFSAPSSGHQVIGIERIISYPMPADEPRFAELMARLAERMGGPPQKLDASFYRFQYDNGRLVSPPGANRMTCQTQHNMNVAEGIPRINQTGDCDVVMTVEVRFGMSADHIKRIVFTLADNERTKANVGADFAFFDAYARDLQSRARGAQPKL